MKGKGTVYDSLYTELEGYERSGICILIDGNHASPMQVVSELMAKESGSYMRDYEWSPEGQIESLSFVNVNKEKEEEDNLCIPLLSDYQKNV